VSSNSHGIVLELQRDCLNSSVSASAILRKARVIAFKLDLTELADWIDSELNGYECKMMDLPPHRHAGGAPKFWNPFNGWCPIIADDERVSSLLTTAYFPQPIAQLEEWISGDERRLTYRYPHPIQEFLREGSDFNFEAVMHVGSSQIVSALEFVRNKILDWTLELEKRGIIGQGMTFDDEQKQQASVVTNHIYGGNIGVLGGVSGDANNTGFVSAGRDVNASELITLANQIEEAIPALPLATREHLDTPLQEFRDAVAAQPTDTAKARGALGSMKAVLEGAVGNLAASGILAAIAQFV
jgi:AbiTii